jgi:hypothetical protein
MRTRFFALTAAIIFAFAQVPAAYARNTDAAVGSDWSSVQAITPGEEIAVRLKDGDRLTGRFASATDQNISFTHDGHKVSLTRESVRNVKVSRGKNRLKGALVGAGAGGGLGTAGGGYLVARGFNVPALVGSSIVGAGVGAAVGAALGLGTNYETVYESKQ